MWFPRVVTVVLCAVVLCCVEGAEDREISGFDVIERTVLKCLNKNESIPCFSERAANALEKSLEKNFSITEGLTLIRNKEKIHNRESRSLKGVNRLAAALSNFFNSHVVSIDFSASRTQDQESSARRRGDGGGGGGGGFMNYDKKEIKKEEKYMRYAFMVLLGIFGLTGPIVMKVLAIMAAKALIASKAALIIVGSVALKKIFQNDHHEKASVKVHTINTHDYEDEHDRISDPYYGYATQYYNSPYSGYSGYGGYNSPYDNVKDNIKVTAR